MGDVVPLTPATQVAAAVTPEAVASRLEELAAEIRAGTRDVERGFIVYQQSDYQVGTIAFGAHINTLEVLGLLDWAAHRQRTE